MVVQHNLQAMNANRMLNTVTNAQGKSTEKLSSGYKINRAADDAAGLSISEKMRKQIRGLNQASSNAQDGISCVQTAEGALNEVHSMLQRMNELSVKAGNGTMSEDDRQNIQDEIDQLVTEIDRVSETTKFNETYLLKGNGTSSTSSDEAVSGIVGGKMQSAIVKDATGNIFSGTIDQSTATALAAGTEDTATVAYKDADGNTREKEVTFKTGADAAATAANLAAAIKDDDELSGIFEASSDKTGKLIIESKLDATETDDTKNSVTNITFKSASNAGATRLTKFVAGSGVTAATGESYELDLSDLADGNSITIGGKTYTYDAQKNDTSKANSFKNVDELQKLLGDDYKVGASLTATKTDKTYDTANKVTGTTVSEKTSAVASDATLDYGTLKTAAVAADFKDVAHTNNTADTATTYTDIKLKLTITQNNDVAAENNDALNLSFQVGADTTKENKIEVSIDSMDAKSLGINKLKVTGADSKNADAAVNTISDAIKKVSSQRSALGAVQNRLEHTISNLDNIVENTTSAESAIRDTDMAEEMVNYSKNNILAQAGQSMLAQANQSNQGVLSLLQ